MRTTHPEKSIANSKHASGMRTCVYDFCRRLRNTTYQHDSESDLDYAMARYYASRTGRFMTPDPGHIGANLGDPQSWNAYVYSANDPINRVDPSGLTDCYVDGLQRDCSDALRLVGIGAADFCPDNICSGWDSNMGAFMFFFAAPGGASGYVGFDDLAYVHETHGELRGGDSIVQRSSDEPSIAHRILETIKNTAVGIYREGTAKRERCDAAVATLPKMGSPDFGERLNAVFERGDCEMMIAEISIGPAKGVARTVYEWHHAVPKYLGGAVNGLLVRLPKGYHQQITNAFRKAWAYGQNPPTQKELIRILEKVYSQFPLPK